MGGYRVNQIQREAVLSAVQRVTERYSIASSQRAYEEYLRFPLDGPYRHVSKRAFLSYVKHLADADEISSWVVSFGSYGRKRMVAYEPWRRNSVVPKVPVAQDVQ